MDNQKNGQKIIYSALCERIRLIGLILRTVKYLEVQKQGEKFGIEFLSFLIW